MANVSATKNTCTPKQKILCDNNTLIVIWIINLFLA